MDDKEANSQNDMNGKEANCQDNMNLKKDLIEKSKELDEGTNTKNLANIIIAGFDDVEEQIKLANQLEKSNENLTKVIELLNNNTDLPEVVKNIPSEDSRKQCEEMFQSFPNNFKWDDKDVKAQVLEGLIKKRSVTANLMLKLTAFYNIALTLIQVVTLITTYKAIRRAKNIHEESLPVIKEVGQMVENLERLAEQITMLMLKFNSATDNEKATAAEDINNITSYMQFLYFDAMTKLNKVKVEMNGCYQELDLKQDNNLLIGGLSLFASVIPTVIAFCFCPPVGIAIATTVGLLAAGGVAAIIFTNKMLEELRASIQDAEKYEKKLIEIRQKIIMAHKWKYEHSTFLANRNVEMPAQLPHQGVLPALLP